ncbi:MAG: UvrD-helicase domain-containing protein [Chloroflexi bacterium]|nr:UvrD-helicase domain-containing protein [Chloroflexota bacterium]
MSLLSQYSFKGNQEKAVTDSARAIAVTAGAGSGKTLSLVGRYLHLLEQDYSIRSILAITFTEKAAREMRSRIRDSLSRVSTDQNSSFIIHPSSFDSARIGTIHSLCAELLRSHPAEAGLDPAFEVLEEGLAAALQAEAIDSALAWASTDEQSAALFEPFKENELRQILNALLARRLDVDSLLPSGEGQGMREKFASTLASYLAEYLDSQKWLDSLAALASHHSSSPEDKLELARQSVIVHWTEIQSARATQNWDDVLITLTALRKSISTQGQKNNWDDIETVREAMKDLRDIYDAHLKFLAEKSRFSLDEKLAVSLPAVHRLLDQTFLEYQRLKEDRLDFDDLESLTAQLLTAHPEVRAQLQTELRAVLVDEFQDTNDRQRQIVYALTGFSPLPTGEGLGVRADSPLPELGEGSGVRAGVDLFIVGDSKQGIYKFRGADVTVFRQVQADIRSSGGLSLDLDLTFRAHKPLLETLNFLLAPILGETDDPVRPYAVPFAPLKAYRQKPERETIQPPFVEFHLGLGENAEEGRQSATQALAERLRQLHETEGFDYGEMALLFRSSTAFPVYESALEAANIPFVTVAGRGFYDRPEIRDLLNALAAIADPTDDLALVGLLRSPAFAIPDSEIYRLRVPEINREAREERKENQNFFLGVLSGLRGSMIPSHQRAYSILDELHALAGRASAAAVLKRFLDLTHYRAILASDLNGARLVRNVEKLLADAHRSRLVSLTGFLAYVQTLRDVSFREGEAPSDPSATGAVQLMTVHKAKGLEFPLTVLADASYEYRSNSAKIQIASNLPITKHLLLDVRADDFHPTAWQLASRREDDRAEAEDNRLLYVAATRAKEKLLISGHVKQKKDGSLSLAGWLDKFSFLEMATSEHSLLENGTSATIYASSQANVSDSPQPDSTPQIESPPESDLLEPLAPSLPLADDKTRARESAPPQRVWRVVSKTKRPRAPAWLVGRLVHESLRRWRFNDLDNFIKPFALESGLTDDDEIRVAIHESRRLLERLRAHPLFHELDAAERHHEVPYFSPEGRGYIDLLYRVNDNWHIIDFKTDEARSDDEARAIISREGYNLQVARYAQAVATQLNVQPKTRLVFLNVNGEVKVYE